MSILSKKIILITLLSLYTEVNFAQNKYTLISMYDDKNYYSVVDDGENIFLGTNKGVYKIDQLNNIILFDNLTTGSINSSLKKKELNIKFLNPPPFVPLQEEYLNSITDLLIRDKDLFIISRGKLFVFRELWYNFSPYESVRTITKNYIGSYSGIFKGNDLVNYPTYTNGQIKEFEEVTFICYDGLVEIINDQVNFIYDYNLNDKKLGRFSNIFKLSKSQFIVISSKGIYLYNTKNDGFELIYDSNNSPVIPTRKIFRNGYEFREFGFSFGYKNTIKLMNLETFEVSKITFDQLSENIIDIVNKGSHYYLISDQKKLYKLSIDFNNPTDYTRNQIIEVINLHHPKHTIEMFDGYIVLTGNNGLSIYDTYNEKLYERVLIEEFNKGSVYLDDKSLKIGGLYGVYSFENFDLSFKKILQSMPTKSMPINYWMIFSFINLVLIGILTFLYISNRTQKGSAKDILVDEIKDYIDKNINEITINSITVKFNLDYNQLYKLNNEFKPGKYISEQRQKIAAQLIKKDKHLKEIAEETGYSQSYLIRRFGIKE
jgi:AraC-like DNA-binding protein